MLTFIEKLQKKPEATRRKILYVTVSACVAVIFGVWVTTLPSRLAGVSDKDTKEVSPLGSLKEAFGGIFSNFSSTIVDIKGQAGAIRSSLDGMVSAPVATSTEEIISVGNASTSLQNSELNEATTTTPTATSTKSGF